jgi:hypothetical protein
MTDIPEPPTDLTALMSLDPLNYTKQDLDKIIEYQRKQRRFREAGGKTKKATGEAPAVDIKALLGKIQVGPTVVKSVPKETVAPTAPAKGFIRRL